MVLTVESLILKKFNFIFYYRCHFICNISSTIIYFLFKTYVQDLISVNFSQMYELLVSKKGHIYICGDVRMAEEVTNTIEAGLQREGNMNLEDAKLFINEMKENQRFHEDIFGNSFNNFNVECKNCPDEI